MDTNNEEYLGSVSVDGLSPLKSLQHMEVLLLVHLLVEDVFVSNSPRARCSEYTIRFRNIALTILMHLIIVLPMQTSL